LGKEGLDRLSGNFESSKTHICVFKENKGFKGFEKNQFIAFYWKSFICDLQQGFFIYKS
jgi:hypothetical protein